jgi:hypothetical protein
VLATENLLHRLALDPSGSTTGSSWLLACPYLLSILVTWYDCTVENEGLNRTSFSDSAGVGFK